MGKRNHWITAAVFFLAAGALLCALSIGVLGFDFKGPGAGKYVTNTYEVRDEFADIKIDGDTEKITFLPAEDAECRIVCYEDENDPHHVRVENGILIIDRLNPARWHLNIGIFTESPTVTAYLPQDTYRKLMIDADTGDVEVPRDFSFDSISIILDTGDVSCFAPASEDIEIRTDTGHITVSGVSAAGLRLKSDTGRMELSDVVISGDIELKEGTGKALLEHVSCTNLVSKGSTGSLAMTDTTASGEFNLERSTGDIEFHGCDAEKIYAKTNTGDVTGTLLTEKVFAADSDTGKVDVPGTSSGGRCEITTDTGDIRIRIQ